MSEKASENYRYHNSWKNDNFRKISQEKKQRRVTKNEAKNSKSDKFTKKIKIAIAILDN